jgi:hypothetical protein
MAAAGGAALPKRKAAPLQTLGHKQPICKRQDTSAESAGKPRYAHAVPGSRTHQPDNRAMVTDDGLMLYVCTHDCVMLLHKSIWLQVQTLPSAKHRH